MTGILEKLLGRRDSPVPKYSDEDGQLERKPKVPPNTRVYSIGDIHGRLDLLRKMHEMIEEDAAGYEGSLILVYLGDYIDRGDESKQVIDTLIESAPTGFDSVFLLGNHEQAMLDFLKHPHIAAPWLYFGGRQTLASYGIYVPAEVPVDEFEGLCNQFSDILPDLHLTFLNGCRLYHIEGDYCFVHAGIRPGIPIKRQRKDDLLWIRGEFINSREMHSHVVVHGHSINPKVEMHFNRIGIDTGAFNTGVLTCLVLENDQHRLIQTGRK